ncbi:MAG: EndoU domain-containing protein [Verrucomicrobia bacterium]|nr:EndoU domain-containing protein [Verrucomicrobiota bacterium]
MVNLASPQRTIHILDGDATGGGHRAGTGISGKTEFPASWSDAKIMHEISDVVTDPTLGWSKGKNGNWIVKGTCEGIDIKVIVKKDGSDIVSGYPTNTPKNP